MKNRGHLYRRLLIGTLFLAPIIATQSALAAPRWVLVYYRQVGHDVNGNRHTFEHHLFKDDGSKAVGVGITNLSNANFAIFGTTDVNGYQRVNTDPNNFYYDFRVYQSGVATDQSPNFYWQNDPAGQYYTFETQWLYVSDASRVVSYPTQPVYHYDQVNGLNGSNVQEPPGYYSDAFCITNCSFYADYQAQTFVVPAGINRIVSAQAAVVRGNPGLNYRYKASIRQGSPTGVQVGPTVTARCLNATEFFPVLVNWGTSAVPVTPGQTYALRIDPDPPPNSCESSSETGFNAFVTQNNNYAGGQAYNGPNALPSRDMLAIVVGIGFDLPPPNPAVITRSPASFARSVYRGNNVPNDSFTVGNSGGAGMDYTISDNAAWLSTGSSGGHLDANQAPHTIGISYATSTLAVGNYTGTITIAAPLASNSPQTLPVQLTVQPPQYAPCDFDHDGDVDQSDFAKFQRCLTGIGNTQTDPTCAGAVLDGDEDTDGGDLIVFLTCFSGADVPANTLCAG